MQRLLLVAGFSALLLAAAGDVPLAADYLKAELGWWEALAGDPRIPPAYGACGSAAPALPGQALLAIDDPAALQAALGWIEEARSRWLRERGLEEEPPDRASPLSGVPARTGELEVGAGRFFYLVRHVPGENASWGIALYFPQEGSCLVVKRVEREALRRLLGGPGPDAAPPPEGVPPPPGPR